MPFRSLPGAWTLAGIKRRSERCGQERSSRLRTNGAVGLVISSDGESRLKRAARPDGCNSVERLKSARFDFIELHYGKEAKVFIWTASTENPIAERKIDHVTGRLEGIRFRPAGSFRSQPEQVDYCSIALIAAVVSSSDCICSTAAAASAQ